MKFGGTSVANKEAIQRAISIVRGRLDQRPVVVVSAMSKVTDSLYRIAGEAAAQHEAEIASLLDQLRNRHIDTASELLADSGHFLNEAISDINTICDYLEKVALSVCVPSANSRLAAKPSSSRKAKSSRLPSSLTP